MTFVGIQGGGDARAQLTRSLISELKSRGLRVSVLADGGAEAEIDIPGKDSYEHRRAGACEVLAVSRLRWALVHEARPDAGQTRPPLDRMLARLAPADIVLAPGIPAEAGITLDLAANGSLRARAADGAADGAFQLDSPGQIADFIIDAAAEKQPIP